MDRITFRTLIRQYSNGVQSGAYDPDLSRQERKFVVLLLNTASNHFAADTAYQTLYPEQREAVVRGLIDGQWEANVAFLLEAASTSARTAYGTALARAVDILKGI